MISLKKEDLVEGFVIEPNSLVNDDCLNAMKFIPDGSISMILTDPPYGTTACKWDSVIPLDKMWEQLKRIVKPNGAIVMFGNQPFTSILVTSNLEMFKYQWVWDKVRGSNFATVKIRPFNSHEDVVVFYAKQPTYNPQMVEGKPYTQKQGYVGESKQTGLYRKEVITVNEGVRYPLSIIKQSKESGFHPTQKPVALMEYLIKTYTNENETVLDFTAGSFTTGVACVNTNRKFIGIEMDKGYFDIGVGRIKERIKCLDLKIEPEISTAD